MRCAAILLSVAVAGCERTAAPAPPAECSAAWDAEDAADLVSQLERATSADRAVWRDYDVGDAAYVLNAGASESGGACLGLWQDGVVVSYVLANEAPSLLTPLYGYWFAPDWLGRPDADAPGRGEQPEAVQSWLESVGVRTAILLPVEVPDFPIDLPALDKLQLGIHEAFHIDVQGPRWWADTGDWPAWERQPDRSGLRVCYTATDDVEAALAAEREHLAALIEALLDGDTARACASGRAFLQQRNARYQLLSDVSVMQADSTPGTCAVSEAIMELEEGTADWASWPVLHDLGLATRDRLMGRYRATQNDVFYLTGAMQLHAVQLMEPAAVSHVVARIASSESADTGSPTAILAASLQSFCR